MARRPGPSRKPAALEKLQGGPSHRPLNAEEPKPAVATSIAAPGWLDRPARDVWNSLAPELHRLGLLTVVDVQMLAGGCRWWAVYRAADAVLKRRARSRKLGLTDETKANGRQAIPEVEIARKAFKEATDVFSRFGITPSERTRVHAPQPKGVPDGSGSGEAHKPKDPHDELAARRARRQHTAGGA